jgi:hypothetical protein
METSSKKQTAADSKRQKPEVNKPNGAKQLSKAGQWMRDNPGGIFEVRDWRAVNR